MSEMPLAALARCQKRLREAGIEDARSSAQILVESALGLDISALLCAKDPVTQQQQETLSVLIDRVVSGEPVQYAVGYADCMGLRFVVTRDVLIPRFDTETLVQWAILAAPRNAKVLDVCTGSGCVALAIKSHRPDLEIFACDISKAALDVALENASRLKLDVRFAQGDLCAPYASDKFDIIVSNPPYVSRTEWDSLSTQVCEHEPKLALWGGNDGLDVYRSLIPQAGERLVSGGGLGVEIGFDQAGAVTALFKRHGFCDLQILPDMERRPRVVAGEWRKQDE